MNQVLCEGWWEQGGFGRQPMEQLVMEFDGGSIRGSGIDIVGPFAFDGRITRGTVSLIKQYIDQHSVRYVGTFDGEGTFDGTWEIESFRGRWRIRVLRPLDESTSKISEWPVGD